MIWLGIVIGIFLIEYRMKKHFEETLKIGQSVEKWKGYLILNKYYNKGIAFDRLAQHQKSVIGITSVIIASLGIYLLKLCDQTKHGEMKLQKLSLALILGGAISNLWDRITKKHVVDYFSLSCTKIRHIVFNIADFCIFAGTFLLAFTAFQKKK